MNRPGQPPQRPPSLGPAPGIGGPFRGPYPTYGLPPRNMVPGYPAPGLQNHRTTQNMVPQPTPGAFVQPRTPGGFPFGAANPQQQQQSQSQQSHPQLPLPPHQQQQGQPTQQQPPPGAHPGLSHLQQNSAPNIGGGNGGGGGGTAPSVSSTSELGLDPNDFPALGATPSATASASNATPATSYASQAGTGVPPSGSAGTPAAGSALPRDFTADDFPALGGGPTSSQQQQSQQQGPPTSASHDGHPPGLNGLPGGAGQPNQPGLLNLGPRVLQGLQVDNEKQRHMKLSAAAQAAWNQPPGAGAGAAQGQQAYQNGSQPQPQTPGQQAQGQAQAQAQTLHAPPGVAPPAPFAQQQQQPQPQQSGQAPAQAQGTPFVSNGNGAGAEGQALAPGPVPQTPAQQVLMSAADRWGLLGLLAMLKSADPDQALLAVGTDLGTMGLDMQQQGNLYSTFITPWADSSAAHTVEPDFHLPGCYNVQPPPPGPSKAAAFSDETLFFMFYSAPRDALQEIAAQELYNRNWRYHKELRVWLTKESGTAPSQKVPGGEQGTYTFWDADNWGKERKEMVVLYADLEEKAPPPFAAAAAGMPGGAPPAMQPQMQMAGPGALAGMGVQPQVRGAFQGVSMAAM
ncbi:hypothetical protein BC834DRAFT_909402 [Gloeopeniophorella convolvens]|nr:hypothetical protein BC834DRAFT_909402 [Gloeopeniophorella convolvens]